MLLSQLQMMDKVESEHIGFAGVSSANYQTAKSLWNISSIDALAKLTDDNNKIVRCYAFIGLLEKKADKELIKNILLKHKNDRVKINTLNGCIGSVNDIITFMQLSSISYTPYIIGLNSSIIKTWYILSDTCVMPETAQNIKFMAQKPNTNYCAWHLNSDSTLSISNVGKYDGVYLNKEGNWRVTNDVLQINNCKFEIMRLSEHELIIKKCNPKVK